MVGRIQPPHLIAIRRRDLGDRRAHVVADLVFVQQVVIQSPAPYFWRPEVASRKDLVAHTLHDFSLVVQHRLCVCVCVCMCVYVCVCVRVNSSPAERKDEINSYTPHTPSTNMHSPDHSL